MNVYYYVSYACRYRGQWSYACKLLKEIHPLTWCVSANKNVDERYVVLSWQEITASEYEQYEGKF